MSEPKKSLCVAIVEDDPYISDLLTIRLRMAGYDSFVVDNGLLAPSVIADRMPDGIFLDLGLPGQDGFAVLKSLDTNELTRAIPVMIITAHGDRQEKTRAEAHGIVHFLVKPFNDQELLARTSIMLNEDGPRRLIGPVTYI
ncbi:response regulator [Asticcacaulis biprosthecium]|uniref:response regulator n=1 Tax=Asticcacaulis biprosthecium TaxID=76891 RepID=UPI00145D00E2|nr:response regulator [Asticcacaulis biprosthecium]